MPTVIVTVWTDATGPGVCATDNRCFNGGTCIPRTGYAFECKCPINFSGPLCLNDLSAISTTSTTHLPASTPIGNVTCDETEPRVDGCHEAEIIYMIEYSQAESSYNIRNEGDYINNMMDKYRVDESNVRVGVVVYHDTVKESIQITDYKNDVAGLKNRISSLTRYCTRSCNGIYSELTPSGVADLAGALDYVREHAFKDARPGVPRMVVPILHSVHDKDVTKYQQAAQRLKEDCIQILALVVEDHDSYVNEDAIKAMVSRPVKYNYFRYSSFGTGVGGLEASSYTVKFDCGEH